MEKIKAVLHLKNGEKAVLSADVSKQMLMEMNEGALSAEEGYINDGNYSYPIREIQKIEWIR
ncbi:hypothetical protein [Bacillus safensis]|uniref:hypothetical protein n=1 Tax=Bacillus safensis TaxID=561879 RepID=UPI0030004A10